jgi:hypothetical protein
VYIDSRQRERILFRGKQAKRGRARSGVVVADSPARSFIKTSIGIAEKTRLLPGFLFDHLFAFCDFGRQLGIGKRGEGRVRQAVRADDYAL